MRTLETGATLAGLSLLAGCYSHSFPSANTFILPAPADCVPGSLENCLPENRAHVFVDPNGTFYPSSWRNFLHVGRRWPEGSLLNHLAGRHGTPEFRSLVEADQARELGELRAFGAPAERIFIFVHGYNNTVSEADEAYRMIEARLDLKPGDRIIRFYWDGLTASGVGPVKIWFNAVSYSQLAGARGLRQVLNQFHGKRIYLIGHSRGMSVILSALSDPPYDPDFVAKTIDVTRAWPEGDRHLFDPAPLEKNENHIQVIVAAPAVDRIDFCRRDRALPDCPDEDLRSLGSQVESVRYTVNQLDPVLRKFVGLTKHFNPTGLGTDPSVGAGLKAKYDFLQAYCMRPERHHTFTWYVQQPAFARMLAEAGIGRTDNSSRESEPSRPVSCG